MQTIRPKRKTYPPDTYAVLIRELNQAMTEVPKLKPDRDSWDVEGDWSGTGTIHFVDSRYQPVFASFADFDCRTIKLTNYGQPAARISFFQKFRYWVLKESSLNEKEKHQWVSNYLDKEFIDLQILQDKCDQNTYTGAKLSQVRGEIAARYQQLDTWQAILDDLDSFELAVSNYERRHHYCTMNYKYLNSDLSYANSDVHLLNPQKDRGGNITQLRYNIVFIDMVEILRPHPHQHKEIDSFLGSFPVATTFGRQQLYAKPKDKVASPSPVSEPRPVAERQPQQLGISFNHNPNQLPDQ